MQPAQDRSHAPGRMPKATARRRVLIVDDHPIVSSGISAMLEREKDIEVCGIAEDYASTLEKVDFLKPELVILDLSLQGRSGLELLKDIKVRQPKAIVLVLSVHDESLYAARAIRAGASGYVMKQEATDCLIQAIRSVLRGEIHISQRMEKRMVSSFARRGPDLSPDPLEALSDRELEVFRMIGQGKGTREIARVLCLSVKTIESHRAHVRDKLGLKNASEVMRHAVELEHQGGGPGT